MIRICLSIVTFLIATATNGQSSPDMKSLSGKTFVSMRLEYLNVLNDSTLLSSINSYTDTALFFLKNDTFYIKQRYLQTDQTGTKWMERVYDYKLVKLSVDTFKLKNNYRFDFKPSHWEDTLVFVNIENLKEQTTDFKFLRLDFSSPWSGTRHITIDSLGKVTFIVNPVMYSINNPGTDKNAKPKNIKGQLAQEEFKRFNNLLSNSLPSRLPLNRSCPIDGTTSNFEIIIGAKRIKSKGCNLSWTHAFLLNYLNDIDHNNGFIKSKM